MNLLLHDEFSLGFVLNYLSNESLNVNFCHSLTSSYLGLLMTLSLPFLPKHIEHEGNIFLLQPY